MKHTPMQRALDCQDSRIRWVKKGYGLKHPTPSGKSICSMYNTFTMCTIRNQFDIVSIVVRKGKTVMSCQGKHQTLTKQRMRYQGFHGKTWCISTSNATQPSSCPRVDLL